MATTIDVAQYIYDELGWIDSGRLMKLTYYSQAWSLGWFGRSMVAEEFQAWPDGPVEPNLHSQITHSRSSSTPTEFPSANTDRLSDTDKAIIDSVIDFCGDFSTQELIEKSQAETPWQDVRVCDVDGQRSNTPLSQSSMKAFYAIQEIECQFVPDRPKQRGKYTSINVRDRLSGTANRWKSALDLLADK